MKWRKTLILTLIGITNLSALYLFMNYMLYRAKSSELTLFENELSKYRIDERILDQIRDDREEIKIQIVEDVSTLLPTLLGLFCISRAFKESKTQIEK
jgi:hypothetical protein